MKWLNNIFNYLRPGWEGRDGKLSYRRVFQYAFGVQVLIIANMPVISDNHFKTMVLLLVTYLLIENLIRMPEIIQLLSSTFFSSGTGKLPEWTQPPAPPPQPQG